MAIELTLLIVDGETPTWGFAHTIIEFGYNKHELFDLIKESKVFEKPDFKLSSHFAEIPDGTLKGEHCYGEVKITPYGDPITYITRLDFVKVFEDEELEGMQKAAVDYCKAATHVKTIGLYWK